MYSLVYRTYVYLQNGYSSRERDSLSFTNKCIKFVICSYSILNLFFKWKEIQSQETIVIQAGIQNYSKCDVLREIF